MKLLNLLYSMNVIESLMNLVVFERLLSTVWFTQSRRLCEHTVLRAHKISRRQTVYCDGTGCDIRIRTKAYHCINRCDDRKEEHQLETIDEEKYHSDATMQALMNYCPKR